MNTLPSKWKQNTQFVVTTANISACETSRDKIAKLLFAAISSFLFELLFKSINPFQKSSIEKLLLVENCFANKRQMRIVFISVFVLCLF